MPQSSLGGLIATKFLQSKDKTKSTNPEYCNCTTKEDDVYHVLEKKYIYAEVHSVPGTVQAPQGKKVVQVTTSGGESAL